MAKVKKEFLFPRLGKGDTVVIVTANHLSDVNQDTTKLIAETLSRYVTYENVPATREKIVAELQRYHVVCDSTNNKIAYQKLSITVDWFDVKFRLLL